MDGGLSKPPASREAFRTLIAARAIAAATLLMDLLWLGLVAREVYDSLLGPLKRSSALLPAAALFYSFYVGVILIYAVRGATSVGAAARRGAALGLVVYASYELTNWAVVRDWPALLVPVDTAWGVALTATAATVGKWVDDRLRTNAAPP